MTNQSYPRNNDLSCEKVKELFDYKDGELFWKKIGGPAKLFLILSSHDCHYFLEHCLA
jgi:hypothetical protein